MTALDGWMYLGGAAYVGLLTVSLAVVLRSERTMGAPRVLMTLGIGIELALGGSAWIDLDLIRPWIPSGRVEVALFVRAAVHQGLYTVSMVLVLVSLVLCVRQGEPTERSSR